MKKALKLLMVMLLAIGAGSFLITGCDSPTDGDRGATGATGTAVIPTGTINATSLQNLVDRGAPILIGGTVTVGAGIVDLKSANITVDGTLTLSAGTVLKALTANINVTDNGWINMTGGGAVIVPASKPIWTERATSSGVASIVTLADVVGANDAASSYALESLTIDTSGNIVGTTSLATGLGSNKRVYILNTLTSNAALDLSTGVGAQVIPLGSITASAAITLGAAALSGDLTVSGAALTTGTYPVTVNGDLTTTGAGLVTLGGNLTVRGGATIGGAVTTSTGAVVASFGDSSTITGVLTTGVGGLTIAGEGSVALAGVPVLANGLTVTNTAGVTFANTVSIPADKAIDASEGKVTFGTAANSVTIEKGTLGSEDGVASVASGGVITLAYASTDGAYLVLEDEGSIAIAGTGRVAIGTVAELKGAGSTWTAGTDTVTFAATGAAAGVITGGTSATLTPSGNDAELNLTGAAQALTISGTSTKFTLDLSSAGKITFADASNGSTITLTANTDGIKLSDSLAIVGTATAGDTFTGAFVLGTANYHATTHNVSLVSGVITHTTATAAGPAAINKDTTAAALAKATS